MSVRWAELCAGAAATTLQLLGGSRVAPVVSWMGGKRRYAPAILAAMGLRPRQPGLESVLLADAGPWGWVWPALLEPEMAGAVAAVLRGWEGRDPRDLWDELASRPPADDLAERTAGWLCLQAATFQGKPVTVRDGRWVTHGYARASADAVSKSGSCWSVGRVLAAVEALPPAPGWAVFHGDAAEIVDAIAGHATHVYIDPPYVGRTGYGWDLERDRLLELADRLAHAGAVVAVSEAVPLELPGWHHVDLSPCGRRGAGPEWLTLSRRPARVPAVQLDLLEAS